MKTAERWDVSLLRPSSLSSGVLSWLLPLTILLSLSSLAAAEADLLQKQYSAVTPTTETDCRVNCTNVPRKPVCGTDGRSYHTKCHVKQLRKCGGRNVRVESAGRCRGPRGSQCLVDRRLALAERGLNSDEYVPDCKPNGAFARTQCHAATGFCWCVTADGRPLPGSPVKDRNFNCRRHSGSSAPRGRDRSKSRKKGNRRRGHQQAESRSCRTADRTTFNANLLTLFSVEYNRVVHPSLSTESSPGTEAILDTPERRILDWKFSELDTNNDNKLKKKEVRTLRNMVKKHVRPKNCARNFDEHCDADGDELISRREWTSCLGVENARGSSNGGGGGGGGRRTKRPPVDIDLNLDRSTPRVDSEHGGSDPGPNPLGVLQTRAGAVDAATPQPPTDAGISDCPTERSRAEELHLSDPDSANFIPDCRTDGTPFYQREQCHSGYCWCVNETTGEPIPGTSTHNVMPDCANTRLFKGCPYLQKRNFLEWLLDKLATEMVDQANNRSSLGSRRYEPQPEHSMEERAVRWKLAAMDINGNGILEKSEVKEFKSEIQRTNSQRKCGRNFVMYCDVNNNGRIEMDEWIDCTGINDQTEAPLLPKNPKRKGPNPFSSVLHGN